MPGYVGIAKGVANATRAYSIAAIVSWANVGGCLRSHVVGHDNRFPGSLRKRGER